jgi:hypothetical protein
MFDNGICSAPEDSLVEDMESAPTVGDPRNGTSLAKKFERDSKSSGGAIGGQEEVSLYRRELAVIHFNTKTRPAPAGVRGTEICIPKVTYNSSNSNSESDAKGISGLKRDAAPVYNIVRPFEKLRTTGKQNELFSKTCFVLHERTSRLISI